MFHPENWSIANESDSLNRLKGLTAARFYNHIVDEVKDKTIEWKLHDMDTGTESIPRVLDLQNISADNGSITYFITLHMTSKQTMNVWDRMGRPVVADIEPPVSNFYLINSKKFLKIPK